MKKYRVLETHTYCNVYEVEAETEDEATSIYLTEGERMPEYDKDLDFSVEAELLFGKES